MGEEAACSDKGLAQESVLLSSPLLEAEVEINTFGFNARAAPLEQS